MGQMCLHQSMSGSRGEEGRRKGGRRYAEARSFFRLCPRCSYTLGIRKCPAPQDERLSPAQHAPDCTAPVCRSPSTSSPCASHPCVSHPRIPHQVSRHVGSPLLRPAPLSWNQRRAHPSGSGSRHWGWLEPRAEALTHQGPITPPFPPSILFPPREAPGVCASPPGGRAHARACTSHMRCCLSPTCAASRNSHAPAAHSRLPDVVPALLPR